MEQVYENHRVAAKACVLHENGLEMPQAGYFQQLPELKATSSCPHHVLRGSVFSYLEDFVEKHNQTARKSYVEALSEPFRSRFGCCFGPESGLLELFHAVSSFVWASSSMPRAPNWCWWARTTCPGAPRASAVRLS